MDLDVIILVLLSLLVTAAALYLPNHVVVISNRLWYYVHGEILSSTKGAAAGQSATPDILEKLSGLAGSVASTATTTGRAMAKETGEEVMRQLHEL